MKRNKKEEIIGGLKLIRHNTTGVNISDDPSLPFKFVGIFSPPGFMTVAFIGMFGGSEKIVVRSKTLKALQSFIDLNEYRTNPRLRKITITGPDGVIEEINR